MSAVTAGALAGGALLSHPAVGPALAITAITFFAFHPSRAGALYLVGAGATALIIVLPWLVTVVQRHGIDPLILGATAHATEHVLLRLVAHGPTLLGAFDPIFPAALLGGAMAVTTRQWLIPVWLVILFLVPGGEGRYAAIGWAALTAMAGVWVYESLHLAGLPSSPPRSYSLPSWQRLWSLRTRSTARSIMLRSVSRLRLPPPNVLDDPRVEWWPALTGGSDPIVYFGYEWTEEWDERLRAYVDELKQLTSTGPAGRLKVESDLSTLLRNSLPSSSPPGRIHAANRLLHLSCLRENCPSDTRSTRPIPTVPRVRNGG